MEHYRLADVAQQVPLLKTREVDYKGVPATQYVGETQVLLERPARTNRVVNGKKIHKNIPGAPITVRLIVSEVRDAAGKILALWLLLTNLPGTVLAETIALCYH